MMVEAVAESDEELLESILPVKYRWEIHVNWERGLDGSVVPVLYSSALSTLRLHY